MLCYKTYALTIILLVGPIFTDINIQYNQDHSKKHTCICFLHAINRKRGNTPLNQRTAKPATLRLAFMSSAVVCIISLMLS